MRPVVFNDTVGWLHPAGGGRGVVIAGGHGLDDLRSRRFLTLMARRIAERGLPVLQFDYPGCGNALGDHDGPGRVEAWTGSIGTAIDRLKHETGVADVLVIGFRLGALLAPAAVAGRDDVAGLALLAPPPSGKAYVREIVGVSRMIDAALPPPEEGGDDAPFEGVEAAGFRMTTETLEDLRGLDWAAALERCGVRDLLVMPSAPSPAITRLCQALQDAGTVGLHPFERYNALMSDPNGTETPRAALDVSVAWAGQRARPPGTEVSHAAGADSLAGPGWEERPVVIAGGPEICGVLCLPAAGGEREEVSLFLNAGAVPHVGWARGTVDAARALAARGSASLRIDLPGLGHSDSVGQAPAFLYDRKATADVVRVIDWLEKAGFRRVSAIGTCAGAFQAFHAARRDSRISHLTMINPLCFNWNSAYALDRGVWGLYESSKLMLNRDIAAASRVGPETPASGRSRAPAWKKPFEWARDLLVVSIESAKSCVVRFSPAALFLGERVERWMADIVRRGTRVMVVTSDGDLSLDEIARHFGPEGERLARLPGVTMRRIAACDHTMTPLHGRRTLEAYLHQFMTFEPQPAGTEGKRERRPIERLRPELDRT